MDLILWRHAEAHDWTEGCDDLQRMLTPRGEKQAVRVARWLDRHLPEGARVLCSPARRCEQTAMALGRRYKVMAELAPDASPDALMAAAQWPMSRAPVVIVGHQPTLGEMIARLLDVRSGSTPVRKGAVWWIRHRERDGHAQTLLLAVQSPDTV